MKDYLSPDIKRRPGWNPSRQCTAMSKQSGERCGRQPIPGGDVCVLHGGRALQVQKAAKKRLLEGVDLAIDYLLKLLTPRPECALCGRSDGDRDPVVVRACQLVLDRSEFHPTLTVEHTPPPTAYESASPDDLVEKLESMLADAKAQRDAQRPAIEGVVDDSYVVLDDDERIPTGIDAAVNGTTEDQVTSSNLLSVRPASSTVSDSQSAQRVSEQLTPDSASRASERSTAQSERAQRASDISIGASATSQTTVAAATAAPKAPWVSCFMKAAAEKAAAEAKNTP